MEILTLERLVHENSKRLSDIMSKDRITLIDTNTVPTPKVGFSLLDLIFNSLGNIDT